MNIRNVLFTQERNVCIRTVKIASALQSKGIHVHLAYWGKQPGDFYGKGNEYFTSIHDIGRKKITKRFFWIPMIRKLCRTYQMDLIHCHNAPDKLASFLMRSKLKCPVIYDQHDFISNKGHLNSKHTRFEKICNEENDGAVYITENYKDLVALKYDINPHHMILPNYGLSSLLLPEKSFLPKLSHVDKCVNLVYVGLITQHKDKVRNMLEIFTTLSNRNFRIHVYPTRKKEYPLYSDIPNVIMHKQLPVQELIREISQYDLGIAFLNHYIPDPLRKNELRYGFWNKMYDYLMAGVPVLTFNMYSDMSQFIRDNQFGISLESLDEFTSDFVKGYNLESISKNIVKNRENWTMENQVDRLIEFYEESMKMFKEKKQA